MIHHQKSLLLVVNLVHQAKHRVVVNLQVLLLVPPVVNQVVVNQAHQAVLLVQVQARLLAVVLPAQAAANQALRVPQVAPVHLVALQAPPVVNQVHLLAVPHLVVLPQVVPPVVLLRAVPLANLVLLVVVHQVRCQLT